MVQARPDGRVYTGRQPFARGIHMRLRYLLWLLCCLLLAPLSTLAAGAVAGVSFMQMRFVDDAEALRVESVSQFFGDGVPNGHDIRNIVRY